MMEDDQGGNDDVVEDEDECTSLERKKGESKRGRWLNWRTMKVLMMMSVDNFTATEPVRTRATVTEKKTRERRGVHIKHTSFIFKREESECTKFDEHKREE